MNRRDLYALALRNRGYRHNVARSGKYMCYEPTVVPIGKPLLPIWLGAAGSVRRGRVVSSSVPLSDAAKHKLLLEGEHIYHHGELPTIPGAVL